MTAGDDQAGVIFVYVRVRRWSSPVSCAMPRSKRVHEPGSPQGPPGSGGAGHGGDAGTHVRSRGVACIPGPR
ncbi:hypothetical protein J2Z21_000622 [Streptomyces griseochromogenes]|uniref:Uncharacterized protein n=1 Tax=Streptomyces griseochromogenes TaxID=68214 RepID=A0ABS4LJY8_9ACTN|nr:hypothetical protein [Streptomyces griseochromogenes]